MPSADSKMVSCAPLSRSSHELVRRRTTVAMNIPVQLRVGQYERASFDDFVTAVMSHNASLGKSHRVKHREPKRINLVCGLGAKACDFRANANMHPNRTGIKVTKFQPHTCSNDAQGKRRQYNSTQIERIAKSIANFTPTEATAIGNVRQLQEMVKNETGIELKKTQVMRIVQKKSNSSDQHLAQYRLLKSYIDGLQEIDPEGVYTLITKYVQSNETVQFDSLFVLPSGVKKNWLAHNGMLFVQGDFLKGSEKEMLFIASCRDSNDEPTILSFGIGRIEGTSDWSWFLSELIDNLGGVRVVMSNGTNGLSTGAVQEVLLVRDVAHTLCAEHVIRRDLPMAQLCTSDAESEALFTAIYARTRPFAETVLNRVGIRNSVRQWWSIRDYLCATHKLLDRGIYRLGIVTMNSNGPIRSTMYQSKELPIINMLMGLLGRIADVSIDRMREAKIRRTEDGDSMFLTPYAAEKHERTLNESDCLIVEPLQSDDFGEHKFVVREQPLQAGYTVTLNENNLRYACVCKFEEEFYRPCTHVMAAILALNKSRSSNVVNVWDKRLFGTMWTTEMWLKQHKHLVHRATVDGSNLRQMELVPAYIPRTRGTKRKWSYEPSKTRPRKCPSCGEFGHNSATCENPDIVRVAAKRRRDSVEIADAFIANMTQSTM